MLRTLYVKLQIDVKFLFLQNESKQTKRKREMKLEIYKQSTATTKSIYHVLANLTVPPPSSSLQQPHHPHHLRHRARSVITFHPR